MEIKTKHRIIGVVVLVALAIIIIPMFFGHSQSGRKVANLSTQDANPPQQQTEQLAATEPASNDATNAPQTNDSVGQAAPTNTNTTVAVANAVQTATSEAAATQTADQTTMQTSTDEASTPQNNTADTSSTPVESLKPVSTNPREEDNSTAIAPAKEKNAVPRTKTGAIKRHYALAEETKIKKHEKKTVKHAEKEKVKSASLAHAWTVQLASFTEKANAEALVKQLRAKGFAAYIHQAKSEKGEVSRVFVGPELKKERAELMIKKLHEAFQLKGVVVEYKV